LSEVGVDHTKLIELRFAEINLTKIGWLGI